LGTTPFNYAQYYTKSGYTCKEEFDRISAGYRISKISIDFYGCYFYYHGMNLLDTLTEKTIALNLQGRTKEAIIDELLTILAGTGKIADRPEARRSVLEREKSLSTGMKNGIALPHGKTDAVSEMIACMGISNHGVPFDSMDGEPSRLFIMTLSPRNKTGPHLQFLAEVSRLFKSEEKRAALLAAKTQADIFSIMASS